MKKAAKKRLSDLEASLLFTLQHGGIMTEPQQQRLIKRGLAAVVKGRLTPTEEGRTAFQAFMGAPLA